MEIKVLIKGHEEKILETGFNDVVNQVHRRVLVSGHRVESQ